jgi:putative membrane protein insertion efficiency factor
VKKVFLALIRFYRKYLSPRKGRPSCRYIPTCSQYAVTAIERYGAWKGGWMAAWRLLRCNPFSRGGYDPVPVDLYTLIRRE